MPSPVLTVFVFLGEPQAPNLKGGLIPEPINPKKKKTFRPCVKSNQRHSDQHAGGQTTNHQVRNKENKSKKPTCQETKVCCQLSQSEWRCHVKLALLLP